MLQNHTVVAGGAVGVSMGDPAGLAAVRKEFPTVPALAGEVYPGWLTHWGDAAFAPPFELSDTLRGFMDGGLSFNIYPLHGGTNFGFHSCGNANDQTGRYRAQVTSYDFAAPITEQGVATDRYQTYRSVLASCLPTPPPAVPAAIPTITPPAVTPKPYASLWDNLPAPIPTEHPQPMEMFGQNTGFILYRKQVTDYAGGSLDAQKVHDYATVFVDQHHVGGFSRTLIPDDMAANLNLTNNNDPLVLAKTSAVDATLDILVEGLGRSDFGHLIVDRKGITDTVSLASKQLTGWQAFTLPMDEHFMAQLRPIVHNGSQPGLFFRATLDLDRLGDTYLDMSNWTKGVVWVNGVNLGRYWALGPQVRFYCPAPFLRRGRNEITVFDLHQTQAKPISFAHTLH